MWEVVRRERRGRSRINEGIGEDKWRKYFMNLLGGTEGRVVCGRREEVGGRR